GQQKLVDQNGDGVINEADLVVIGDANPDHFGGMTNSLSYKNWDLSFVFIWRYGGDVYNKNLLPGYNQNLFTNKYGIARERWTPNNQDTRVNSIRGRVLETGIANTSDYIEDGSFLRLQNLSLGYNLPDLVTDRLGLTRLRFYLAADNVFVWTNYSGYDPDVSIAAGTNSALTPAVDFDAYPRATTFRLGIQGTF
ncbi:MAG: TonB-dependent receptor, partial [Bacteroidota bacterium]